MALIATQKTANHTPPESHRGPVAPKPRPVRRGGQECGGGGEKAEGRRIQCAARGSGPLPANGHRTLAKGQRGRQSGCWQLARGNSLGCVFFAAHFRNTDHGEYFFWILLVSSTIFEAPKIFLVRRGARGDSELSMCGSICHRIVVPISQSSRTSGGEALWSARATIWVVAESQWRIFICEKLS